MKTFPGVYLIFFIPDLFVKFWTLGSIFSCLFICLISVGCFCLPTNLCVYLCVCLPISELTFPYLQSHNRLDFYVGWYYFHLTNNVSIWFGPYWYQSMSSCCITLSFSAVDIQTFSAHIPLESKGTIILTLQYLMIIHEASVALCTLRVNTGTGEAFPRVQHRYAIKNKLC